MRAPQSTRVALAGFAAFAVLAIAPGSAAAGRARIELPTPADAFDPRTPLIVPRAGEVDVSKLPGPVTDTEIARLSLGPTGALVGVSVDQTLHMKGVGDFNVVLPGPATHVVGPADQATQPGLRRGTILYQGFVPGTKTLRATATLDPAFEQFRVPLRTSVHLVQEGREVRPPVNGPVEIRIEISNNTERIVPASEGTARPADLADLLESLRADLAAGRAPVAGFRGVPKTLAATSEVNRNRLAVQVPFSVEGSVRFGEGSIVGLRVLGPGVVAPSAPGATFQALVPSAAFPDGTCVIRIAGTARSLLAPRLDINAAPALPDPSRLAPPSGATWRSSLARAGGEASRAALSLAETTMWQVLRLPEFRAYLGNPGVGPASTDYRFATAAALVPHAVAGPERLKVGALILTLFAAVLAIGNAAMLWTRS
jgi:hypothetical protein